MAHEDTTVDFTVLGSPVLIKGMNLDRGSEKASNEAGKTSIFNGIDYCLFTKRHIKLRRGTTNGSTSLTFEHQGSVYQATKRFTADDYTSELLKNGQLISTQKSEVEKYMYNLIGMSRELYEHTIYQNQMSTDAFGSATKQLKTGFITDIMDISVWEDRHSVAKDIHKTLGDYKAKSVTKKEMLEVQISQKKTEVAAMGEEKIQQDLGRKQALLESKKQLLSMQSDTTAMEQQKYKLTGQLQALNSRIAVAEKQLTESNADLEKQRAIYADIQAKLVTPIEENYKKTLLSNALSAEKTVAAKAQEMQTVAMQIDDATKKKPIVLAQPKCPFCRRDMDISWKTELERHLDGEIAALHAKYATLGSEYANLLNMRSGLAEQVEALNKQVKMYTEQVGKTTEVTAKISKCEGIAAALIPELTNNRAERDSAKTQLDDVIKLLGNTTPSQAAVIKADMETIEREIDVFKTKLATIEASKQFITAAEGQLAGMQAQTARYITAENLMKHAANITSINGIQKVKILHALEDITQIANSFLAPVHKGVYFQFDKAKKSGEGFKPVFDVMVVNQYKEVSELEDCSGAEAGIVNFALRMALSTLVANKYDFKYLIIDEGMKDMDEPYLEFIASAIKNVSSQFQVFLVSHMKQLSEEFSNTLIVRKENKISRVLTA